MTLRRASIVALLLAATTSGATTFADLSLQTLLARSAVVIQGEVTACHVENVAGAGLRLVTFCTVHVEETWRGALTDAERARGVVVVGIPGGALGDVAQWVPGAPLLVAGTRAVFLLGEGRGPDGARGIAGLDAGVRAIDADGIIVTRPGDGVAAPTPAALRAVIEGRP